MSQQVSDVGTLFLHESGDTFTVVVERESGEHGARTSPDGHGTSGGKRVMRGRLEVKQTDAGPRPARLRVRDGDDEVPRPPDQFVELARRATRIRISEQTSREGRQTLRELLDGYQLEAKAVRTCRYCAGSGRYSPITSETAIEADSEQICPDCAMRELEREANFRGLRSGARDRLEDLLLEVGDLERITNLLSGNLDPELTKFDEISATVEEVDPVPVDSLDLHPGMQSKLEARFDSLLPVQSLAVRNGATDGRDQLVVSATATGKTLVGEMAGIDRALNGQGKMLFLVPLVALANQKHEDFEDEYGDVVDVSLRVGASRINDDGNRFDPRADVIVGTYEGIDHALRTGRDLGEIGTVVIDEVHTLGEQERGHRLDGLISRLKHYTERGTTKSSRNGEQRGDDVATGRVSGEAARRRRSREQRNQDTQWIYLSATVGNPGELAGQLGAQLVEFEERPVPIERHVTFADAQEKATIENRLVKRAFDTESSKGYRGQTIVFTNSRRRCHEISRKLEYDAAPYHAGLDYGRRKKVERMFADQDLAAVVTTAALAAGVDFPASQVIFDSLAMGIEWLTVQEFHQMLGRAGRPDYHDQGTVYVLVEPDCTYHNSMELSEDEVAFKLLKGEMESVVTTYDEGSAIEETLANLVVSGKGAKRLNDRMVGEVPTKHAIAKLLEYDFIDGFQPTPLGQAVCRHFLAPDEAFLMLDGVRKGKHPYEVVADVEMMDGE